MAEFGKRIVVSSLESGLECFFVVVCLFLFLWFVWGFFLALCCNPGEERMWKLIGCFLIKTSEIAKRKEGGCVFFNYETINGSFFVFDERELFGESCCIIYF